METIKVFIASSEELKIERREFSDMILELNRIFKPRGFEIGPEKWEWLDSSMGPVHKQEEYNRVLKTCEICLVLYWRKFGSYTKIELDTAYTELCAGRKPCKLYVFFKDTRNITPELQHFKSNFESEYGHFFCRFKNVDTLRLRFLLQLENYLNELWGKQNFINIKIKNSRVEVDGIPFANLNLIPFASSNKELQNLLNKIKLAQENVLKDPNNEDLWQTLHDLQVKRDRVESSMLDTARLITQWSVKDHSSHRLTEAIRLFETGDNLGAKNILNSEAIKMDAQSNKNRIIAGMALEKEGRMLVESNRKALETNVKEWQLRIRAIQNEMAEGWFAEVVQIYDIAIDLARNGIENIKFARLLREYADFLRDNNQYHLIRSLYSECLDILRFLVRTDRTIEPELAMTLHNAAIFHTKTKKYVIAEKEYKEAFKMYAHIAKHNPQHIVSIITVLNNMANLYFDLGRNGRAEIIYKKVLEDYRRLAQQDSDIFGPYVASTLTNLARVHDSIKNFSQAEAEFNEALGLQQHFAIQNPEIYEPNIATTLANMANLHNNMQEIEQAEVEYRNSLDIYRRLAKKNVMHMNHIWG